LIDELIDELIDDPWLVDACLDSAKRRQKLPYLRIVGVIIFVIVISPIAQSILIKRWKGFYPPSIRSPPPPTTPQTEK